MQEPPKKVAPESDRISLAGYPAISDWCRSLDCFEIELAEAIGVVGYSASLVRAYLDKRTGRPDRAVTT